MAWSEAARQAAIETRRRKRKGPVTLKQGKYTTHVPRADYADYLREARGAGKHIGSLKARNKFARSEATSAMMDEGIYKVKVRKR